MIPFVVIHLRIQSTSGFLNGGNVDVTRRTDHRTQKSNETEIILYVRVSILQCAWYNGLPYDSNTHALLMKNNVLDFAIVCASGAPANTGNRNAHKRIWLWYFFHEAWAVCLRLAAATLFSRLLLIGTNVQQNGKQLDAIHYHDHQQTIQFVQRNNSFCSFVSLVVLLLLLLLDVRWARSERTRHTRYLF